MAINSTLRRSLSLIAEARCICRSFSTRGAGLRAASDPAKYSGASALIDSLPQTDTPLPSYRSSDAIAQHKSKVQSTIENLANARSKAVRDPSDMSAIMEASERKHRAKVMEGMQHRRWKQGDVYAPHDLSPAEMRKWRQRPTRSSDVFDALALNPINEYKNLAMMSEYMTPLGRIKPVKETGLRKVNQRRIAKAIRRAIGMGWLPSVHKHPEMLRRGGGF